MCLFLLEMLLGKNNVIYSAETVKQCVAICKGNKFSHKFYSTLFFQGKYFVFYSVLKKHL